MSAHEDASARWRDALSRLMEGNARYVEDRLRHPRQSSARRAELAGGQNPFAAILCCADSRVPPELIFDKGLGDLFTVRVAGNVLDDIVVGSFEYAAAHLEVPLILVLGHARCGAVSAAVEGKATEGNLPFLAAALAPAVQAALETEPTGADVVDAAARLNACGMAARLAAAEPTLAPRVRAGNLKVLPAFYRLDSGEVELLEAG